jgi:hypothetical protein
VIHHLFTRQKYDDEPFRHRMDLACRTCIPSVVAATESIGPGFRWVWKAHARHHDEIRPTWKRDPGAVAVIHDTNKLMDIRSHDYAIAAPSEADYR